jgi:hypothetical protein
MATSVGNKVMQTGSRGVTKIVNQSHEDSEGRISFVYTALDKENNIVAEFINGQFSVEYKTHQ